MSPKLSPAVVSDSADDDPVWRAAMTAPIDETPDTEEELAAIEAVTHGGFRPVAGSVVTAEIARRSSPGRA